MHVADEISLVLPVRLATFQRDIIVVNVDGGSGDILDPAAEPR